MNTLSLPLTLISNDYKLVLQCWWLKQLLAHISRFTNFSILEEAINKFKQISTEQKGASGLYEKLLEELRLI